MQKRSRFKSFWRSVRMRPRLYLGICSGLATLLLLLPTPLSSSMRWTIAWNAGGLVYLVSAFRLMYWSRVESLKQRAAMQDDGRNAILMLILLAIFASFGAIAGLINEAKAAKEILKIAYVSLAALTIFVSWSVTQVAFALHYAHEFYRPETSGEAVGGLAFPSESAPDFWDFFYFSTSIGATSQTSDVSIKTKSLRRIATAHAIVSFFFNTTVLALTINLAASLI